MTDKITDWDVMLEEAYIMNRIYDRLKVEHEQFRREYLAKSRWYRMTDSIRLSIRCIFGDIRAFFSQH